MDGILCDELLEEVLRRLPFCSSSAAVSLVSKRWLRLHRSSEICIFLRLSPDNCKPPSLSSFLSDFPRLSLLFITVGGGGGAVSSFPDQILLSVASSCPKLRALTLKPGPVSFFPLLSLSTLCPHLTSLNIVLCRPFSFRWLVFLHSLKKLTVVLNPVPGEFEQVDASIRNFNVELKLETLVLDGIRRGQSFRNLRKLDLSSNDKLVDEEFISMLASFNCLTELIVRGCEGLTNASLVSMFKSCEQLEIVDIMNCPGIGVEAVELFVLNCLQLRMLFVEESKISDVSRSWSSKKFIGVLAV
ncbi:hypothetical protein RHMOL_Rhmol08G0059200 [Rhododendron molle]|uniref:Uncharacterized protein n=1 Tax=Rhododendron molle TaxID=49168 RepID=A0ACC0MM62_RHOML|nr:hypothetical protein RHMOL_Rhmol08G0059200 [Rhododendron molle]